MSRGDIGKEDELSSQPLVTNRVKAATTAALFILVGTLDLGTLLVNAHICDQVEQGILQIRSVIHGEIAAGVVDDAVRRALTGRPVDQQTVDCQLKNVRVVGCFRRPSGLDLHRDDPAVLLDQVIRHSGQVEGSVKKRFFDLAPGACVSVDDPPAGQTGGAPLPA